MRYKGTTKGGEGSWRTTAKAAAGALGLCLAASSSLLMAQVSGYGDKQTGQTLDKPPALQMCIRDRFYVWRLNSLALQREADKAGNTPYWIKKLENISGPGIVVYSLTMTAAVIYWVMSMDPTWYSSVYGLLFLVGQGYSVLAFCIIVSISLSKAEPFKTILRQTEQHDMGKLTFAFVMLNIYLAFAQFLIIWSGNLPEEIPWYLDRIRGHWGLSLIHI